MHLSFWLLAAVATAQDLYALLNTTRSASAKDIRKAYHRAALTTHPDKVEGAEKEVRASYPSISTFLQFLLSYTTQTEHITERYHASAGCIDRRPEKETKKTAAAGIRSLFSVRRSRWIHRKLVPAIVVFDRVRYLPLRHAERDGSTVSIAVVVVAADRV